MDLQDELGRSKRVLEEKHYETARLNEENAKKGDQNMDLRDKEADLRKEIDMLKNQRADNWREINRLKDANDAKAKEGQDQAERIKDIDYQLARTS